jgi:hypothetical protein
MPLLPAKQGTTEKDRESRSRYADIAKAAMPAEHEAIRFY